VDKVALAAARPPKAAGAAAWAARERAAALDWADKADKADKAGKAGKAGKAVARAS